MKWLLLGVICVQIVTCHEISDVFCPLCDMTVDTAFTQHLRGNQKIMACYMAGHLQQLQQTPKSFIMRIQKLTQFASYIGEPESIHCPVCNNNNWTDPYEIQWGPKGNERTYACSKAHAEQFRNNPQQFFIGSTNTTNKFCTGSSAMFNGFQSTSDGTCVTLLSQHLILTTEVKYGIAFVVIVVVSMLLEFWGEVREKCRTSMINQFGYYPRALPSVGSYYDLGDIQQATTTGRTLPFWCRCVLASLYMIHIAVAYLIMLVVMSYESGLFLAVVVGLGLGFFIFKDTDGNEMSKNIDPCCST